MGRTREKKSEALRQNARELSRALPRLLQQKDQQLRQWAGRLEGVSPLAVLARGYALVYGEGGTLLTQSSQVSPGDELAITLREGRIWARVVEHEAGKDL